MTFRIIWDLKALKILDKLPKDISNRIVKRVDVAKNEPKRFTLILTL